MLEIVDIVGYAGAVTGTSFMLPQVFKTLKTKSVEDLSWGMLLLFGLNCILWMAYGFLAHTFPVLLTNVIAFVVLLLQVVLKVRYRDNL